MGTHTYEAYGRCTGSAIHVARARRLVLFLAGLLVAAPASMAWGMVSPLSLTVMPSPLTTLDDVLVRYTFEVSNGNYGFDAIVWQMDGQEILLDFLMSGPAPDEPLLWYFGPMSVTADLGALPLGTYNLTARAFWRTRKISPEYSDPWLFPSGGYTNLWTRTFDVTLPGAMPGDFDFNGRVDTGDINAFILAMTDSDGWMAAYAALASANLQQLIDYVDTNGDGHINTEDINLFVQALVSQGAGSIIPEPGSATLLLVGMWALGRRGRHAA